MKKLVTYLVTLGMMISMVPASVSAADTTPETIAVTEESTEKNADREGAAVAVMNNLNVILSLTEGADSNLDLKRQNPQVSFVSFCTFPLI